MCLFRHYILSEMILSRFFRAQCHQILQHENLRDLKRVRIDGKKTSFWRYQGGMSDNHLATIEVSEFSQKKFNLLFKMNVLL